MATSCCSVRAATMLTRFSDIIMKSKKLIEEGSGNDAVVRITREKLRKQREEEDKDMNEARALRQRLREKQRLALEKIEEEAKFELEDNHLAAMEIVNLCGGSRLARNRWWFKQLGLNLRTDDEYEYDDASLEKASYDLEEVIMQAFKETPREYLYIHLFSIMGKANS